MTDGMTMFRISVAVDSTLEAAEAQAVDFIQTLSAWKGLETRQSQAPALSPLIKNRKSQGGEKDSPFTESKERAMNWLKSQIVPNEMVPEPVQDRRDLMISYRVPRDNPDYRYVFSKASLYDNALAIIAFSMQEEYRPAERIIEAASRIQSPDGDLYFSFNTHNAWPNATVLRLLVCPAHLFPKSHGVVGSFLKSEVGPAFF
jgi:hypothetical protein